MTTSSNEIINSILKFIDNEINGFKNNIFESPFFSVETSFKFGAVQALKAVKIECEKLIVTEQNISKEKNKK